MEKTYAALLNAKVFVTSAALLMLTAWLPAPVISSPEMYQELRALITDRIQAPDERDRVLQSVARAARAGFSDDQIAPVIEKSLEADISGAGLARIVDILVAAREKGLPTRSYKLKVMEGLIKRVNEDRLIRGLERADERMIQAGQLVRDSGLANRASDDLIIGTADAIAAGMSNRELRDVFDTMGRRRVNREIRPEQVMEMVKAARGYGLDSKKIGNFAISLMTNPDATERNIRTFLRNLSDQAHRGGSDTDLDKIMEEHRQSAGGDDDIGEDDGKDEDGSDDGVSGEDGSGEEDPYDEETESHDSGEEESDDEEAEEEHD